ncbi:hypothetical protein BD413DRAFT_593170 [Trametes elegans]|nr:hypothetical protein BD413DRAFT_593170 [Trametes elegans]
MDSASESVKSARYSVDSMQHPRRLFPDERSDHEPPPDWSTCAARMREFDEAMVRNWKEEIDTLLVFAGLFSAVVTAFDIEAYHLLQDDPNQASTQLLQQISQQLAVMNNLTANTSSSGMMPSLVPPAPPFRASAESIRINALWFTSLVFALFSALISIMAKQWLREYTVADSLSSRNSVRLRQYRYDCMVAWRVPEIMALLPLLLQISLILFLVGLIDFLFLLQSTVAGITTALIAVALLFYASTTLTPVFRTSCSFKSPQSWLLVRVKRRLTTWVCNAHVFLSDIGRQSSSATTPAPVHTTWTERDHTAVQRRQEELDLKALTWIHTAYTDENIQDSLIAFLPEITPNNAAVLTYTVLARSLQVSPSTFIAETRSRSCSAILQGGGASLPERTRTRVINMLLKLLECVPRDQDPSHLGALDVLWTLWELCMGACNAEEQDPKLYQNVLNGVAVLLSEGEPFRLRRAALNLLWESTHQWTYLYCPSAVGNIISLARTSHQHRFPDMFLKACAVALLLAPGLDNFTFVDEPTAPHYRQELRTVLRDLARFLRRGNEDGVQYEPRCVGRIAYGLALLAEKEVGMVEAELPAALLESVELGLVDVTLEELLALVELQHSCANYHAKTTSSSHDLPRELSTVGIKPASVAASLPLLERHGMLAERSVLVNGNPVA